MPTLQRFLLARSTRWMFFSAMALGSVFITRGSLLYFDQEDIHPFVLEKLPLAFEQVWLAALHIHVIAAALALPACLLMLSRRLLRRSMPSFAAPPNRAASQAAESDAERAARVAIERRLLQPLKKRDARTSRFSRVRRPQADRRVRVLDKAPVLDARGRGFQSFAVDVRYSRVEDAVWGDGFLGCFYPADGAIYIKRGDAFASSAILLGKRAKAPPKSVCRAAPQPPGVRPRASIAQLLPGR